MTIRVSVCSRTLSQSLAQRGVDIRHIGVVPVMLLENIEMPPDPPIYL